MSQLAKQAAKQVKQTSYVKDLFTDFGNIPLVFVNSAGATLILVFGGRKLFYHPDIGVSEGHRNAKDVQNEGPQRYENADVFRQQTKSFANAITSASTPIMQRVTGSDELYSKWHLDFIKNAPIERPLEETNYFEDDLYVDNTPSEYTLPEDNFKQYKDYDGLNLEQIRSRGL